MHTYIHVLTIQAGYVPKAGFPGTLAPGINFKEDCPFESLPKRILHPWPAMQQIQWCVITAITISLRTAAYEQAIS